MAGNIRELRDTDAAKDFLAPGRKTVVGYLLAMRGHRKKSYGNSLGGLLAELIADKAEEAGRVLPRWPDMHSVWFGYGADGPERNRHQGPFLRYKRSRPIDGLRTECRGHRVELTCTIGKDAAWSNGLGAYITRAHGRCLECDE